MEIYSLINSVWRNLPRNASTFMQCECDRASKRSSENHCLECLKDKLVATGKIEASAVDVWFKKIHQLRVGEAAIIKCIGEGVEMP